MRALTHFVRGEPLLFFVDLLAFAAEPFDAPIFVVSVVGSVVASVSRPRTKFIRAPVCRSPHKLSNDRTTLALRRVSQHESVTFHDGADRFA